jgi:hypothetical protein
MMITITIGDDAIQRSDTWLAKSYGWINRHR